jgi:hypothetical protein
MPGIMKRIARLAVIATLGLVSCASPSYKRNWETTLRANATPPKGCWEGTWVSAANGHTGKLRCIVSDAPAGYRFHYQATWAKFLSGEFSLVCPAIKTGPATWTVSGSKDLGAAMGGTFTHEAQITADRIKAGYRSKLDHGTMELHRMRLP